MIRGKVTSISDAEGRGRIKVSVPSVDSFERWAEPCFLPSMIAIPKVGDVVWIDLEEGDIERPIWMGCLYSKAVFKVIHPTSALSDVSIDATRKLIVGSTKVVEVTVGDTKVALVGGEVSLDVPNNKGTINVR